MIGTRVGSFPETDLILFFKGRRKAKRTKSLRFRIAKRTIDYMSALIALPVVVGVGMVLLALNPVANPGPLFFKQTRMGIGGKRFTLWKFRTMVPDDERVRNADDPLEISRITPLGRIMRRLRIDELPNFLNVLTGDMCLVGPRPDTFKHAEEYIRSVPNYNKRFRVKPGITGLAQVRGGYADNPSAVRRKARFDHFYVRRSSGRLEAYVIAKTIAVIATGFGAK
ncbi:MAG: sugar transferase [Pseudomonadota bacterium]